jgi:hypothetical protein
MEPVEPGVKDTSTQTPTPAAAKPPLKERFKALMEDYGPVAFAVYFAIFFLCIAGFAVAFRMGFQMEGVGGTAGTLGAAWLATKVIQPIRILATLALTPLVGRAWMRRRKPRA